MTNDLKYWLGLNKIRGVGAARFKKLYTYFPNMGAAWEASYDELAKAGVEEAVINNILSERKEINLDEEIEKMGRENISAMTVLDDKYPKLLKEIYNPPGVLYYKGNLDGEGDEFAIAMVGTRKYSGYGEQVAEKMAAELTNQNITTVSGLALGIDSLVHYTTVKNGGRTISVLGAGLDSQNIYPSSNRYLAEKIIESKGLIVSEYPLGTLPLKGNFPQRNRIIAGLSVATVVIEAPAESGALLTARYALEFNREVMAVPGNIYNCNAIGPNNLIKMGAKLVTDVGDILEALNLKTAKEFMENKKISPDSKEEKILLDLLTLEPKHINELIKDSGLDTATVNSTLVLMEMKGKVRNLGNMMYVIAR